MNDDAAKHRARTPNDRDRTAKDRGRTPNDRDDTSWDNEWAEADAIDAKRAAASGRSWLAWQKENEGRAPYSAWLVVPAHLTDYGARPLTGGPYWASPYIWVESPDPSGSPVAGQDNFVHARVFNLGAGTSAPTEVSFFWADPSVGLGASSAHLIGTERLEIQPMSSADVRCSTAWVPTYLNNGHECLFVIAHNHVLDPVIKPFEPWADRHVGQRNVNVLPGNQTLMSMWVPLADYEQASEIFAFALLGRARDGFAWAGTPVATLSSAADQVLHGMHRQLMKGRKPATHEPAGVVYAKHVPAHDVIASIRLTDELKPFAQAGEGQAGPAFPDAERALLGDLMLRLPAGPGTMARFEVELHEWDLALNEIIVLSLTHVSRGRVAGGYVLTVASKVWFESEFENRNETTRTGEPMAQNDDSVLETLVIEHNPQARVTLQLARQLSRYLPIESLDQLREQRPYLVVDDERLPIDVLMPYIVDSLLPVTDLDDLVAKVSAGTRMAQLLGEQSARQSSMEVDSVAASMLRKLQGGAGRAAAIPSGHFAGPSLYGSERAKGVK